MTVTEYPLCPELRPARRGGPLVPAARRLLLAGIMVAIAVVTAAVALATTSRVVVRVSEARLREVLASRAALVEAVWRRTGDPEAALAVLEDAQRATPPSDNSVAIVIGEKEGDGIHFLFRPKGEGVDEAVSERLLPSATVAEPMRLALQGGSGTLVGRDYRGVTVLAAYRPIAPLGWGIVAKLDRGDVLAPFRGAVALTSIAGVILIGIGAVAFLRVSEPMIRDLTSSEKRYRTLYTGVPVGLFRSSPDGRVLDANPAVARILGHPGVDAALATSVTDSYVDPEDGSRWKGEVDRAGEVRGFEFEIRRVDGGTAWVRLSARAVRDAAGGVAAYEGSMEDITAERTARERLRDRERLLDAILEALPVGVWITDETGTIQRGNAAAHEIWQGARHVDPSRSAEYRGRWQATGKLIEPEEWALARAVHAGEVSMDEEIEIECFDGTRKVILNSATPVRDEDGVIQSAVGTNLDVTARVRAEERLAATLAELKRSNEELERFAYVASHDLQEPLRMVSSFTQLLSKRYRGRLDAKADEYIAFAVDGAMRMQSLIDDLLRLSRLGTGGTCLEAVDCAAVVDRCRRDLAAAVEEAGAVVTSDPLPVVHGDEGQLGQLFQNLVANALRFRDGRPPRVHVSAERAGDDWVFAVRDNGIGIAAEHFDRVFQVFQRLNPRADYPGTGIGLAICKKIVERHDGRIWVESTPGEGATFKFTLSARERSGA